MTARWEADEDEQFNPFVRPLTPTRDRPKAGFGFGGYEDDYQDYRYPNVVTVPLEQLRRPFVPKCKLREPDEISESANLITSDDPIPERISPTSSPVIPKKELNLDVFKHQKCVDSCQQDLLNIAVNKRISPSDAHSSLKNDFEVFFEEQSHKHYVALVQDGLAGRFHKEGEKKRVLFLTDKTREELKKLLTKERTSLKGIRPLSQMQKAEFAASSKFNDFGLDAYELYFGAGYTGMPDTGDSLSNSGTAAMHFPSSLDLVGYPPPIRRYGVHLKWSTSPHCYRAIIRVKESFETHDLASAALMSQTKLIRNVERCYIGGDCRSSGGVAQFRVYYIPLCRWTNQPGTSAEELEHATRMLLEVNGVELLDIKFARQPLPKIPDKEIRYQIMLRIARCAIHVRYWPYEQPFFDEQWREFFKRRDIKLPYEITGISYKPNSDVVASVSFHEENFAKRVQSYIVDNMNRDFLRFHEAQTHGTNFYLSVSVKFFVPAEIRYILNDKIKALSEEMRTAYQPDSWIQCRDEGEFLVIEGFPEKLVDERSAQLQDILRGEVFDCSVDGRGGLLYGCGLQLVNVQQKRFAGKVFLSVDRLNERIYMLGCKTLIPAIQKSLQDFVDGPHQFMVTTEIDIVPPRYMAVMTSVLDSNGEKALCRLLGEGCSVKFQRGNKLFFEGTVHQYYQLLLLLDTTQYNVLDKVSEVALCTRAKDMFMSTAECPVCLIPYSFDKFRLSCGHGYCLSCLRGLIQHSLKEGALPIRCVQAKCQIPVDINAITSLLFDEKSIEIKPFFHQRLEPLTRAAFKYAAKICYWNVCIKAGCDGYIPKKDNPAGNELRCPLCATPRCAKCPNPPHRNLTCAQEADLRANDELSIEHFLRTRRANVKRCPTTNCQALILKEEGCNHMHCSYCKIHFCWVCLFMAATQGEVYKHMQENHGGSGGEWAHLDFVFPALGVRRDQMLRARNIGDRQPIAAAPRPREIARQLVAPLPPRIRPVTPPPAQPLPRDWNWLTPVDRAGAVMIRQPGPIVAPPRRQELTVRIFDSSDEDEW